MENYIVNVKYNLEDDDYDEDDEVMDYIVTITISSNDEVKLFESNFSISSLKNNKKKCEIPENLDGEWKINSNTDSVNIFNIEKYRVSPESPYYISFTSIIDSSNHVFHKSIFKYSEAIDEMLIKLKEIYQLSIINKNQK